MAGGERGSRLWEREEGRECDDFVVAVVWGKLECEEERGVSVEGWIWGENFECERLDARPRGVVKCGDYFAMVQGREGEAGLMRGVGGDMDDVIFVNERLGEQGGTGVLTIHRAIALHGLF
jgi:hypothetical protein